MIRTSNAALRRLEIAQADAYRFEVLDGLRRTPKKLSSKFFYDARGSALFERICEQPEYYLTRTELGILERHGDAIAAALGPDVLLMEYGCGSAIKTRRLLDHLVRPAAYVPVEVSESALSDAEASVRLAHPSLKVAPLCADFTIGPGPAALSQLPRRRTVVFFPGSTLGNFDTPAALSLLRKMRGEMGPGGAALVGIDLKKDPATIEAAYNDAAGVTAAFTLNMLARFNRELDADFDLDAFRHRARYHPLAGRIETHIVSRRAQRVRVAGETFSYAADEAMLVEYSCKYSRDDLERLCSRAGLRVEHWWTDDGERFAVTCLTRA